MFAANCLQGQVALVTGASSGLGQHFAGVLAKHGANVVLAARRVEALEQAAAHLRAQGGQASVVALDVCDSQSVATAVDQAARFFGPIGILVNASGIAVTKPALQHCDEDWQSVVDTDLTGAFRVTRSVAAAMVKTKIAGSIVNIASIAGERVGGHLIAYCAAKAGLLHTTRCLAVELAPHNIRVNALAPGYFETPLNREFFASAAGANMLKRVPMRRLGRLEELDAPLLLCASEAGSFMTGSVLTIDGGHTVNAL